MKTIFVILVVCLFCFCIGFFFGMCSMGEGMTKEALKRGYMVEVIENHKVYVKWKEAQK